MSKADVVIRRIGGGGVGREGRDKVELFRSTMSWFLFGQLFIYFLVYLQMFFISPVDKC